MKKLNIQSSKINGKGLYTVESIKKGETIDYIHGPIVIVRKFSSALAKQSLDWIGVGRFSWINTKKSKFRYINHSCDPNVAIVTKRKVIAIKNINQDEELVMDYSFTEADKDWTLPGECKCGSIKCRKKIGPIFSLPSSVYKANKNNIPKNFQKVYSVDCL